MLKKSGFTLIELLVVIAIITILASIVAPKIQNWIERGRMAKAVSEIRNADLAVVKMLADAEKRHIGQFIDWNTSTVKHPELLPVYQAVNMYTGMFYELLRRGKGAELVNLPLDPAQNLYATLTLKQDVVRKLGASYMDIGADPWSTNYQFFAGPFARAASIYPFRCHRTPDGGGTYIYNAGMRDIENGKRRGAPPVERINGNAVDVVGYPCAGDLPVYIYSYGGDTENDQNLELKPATGDPEQDRIIGGYDDINNWDNETGWGEYYN